MTVSSVLSIVAMVLWIAWLALVVRAIWAFLGQNDAAIAGEDPHIRKLVRLQLWWTDPAFGDRHGLLLRLTAIVVLFEILTVAVS